MCFLSLSKAQTKAINRLEVLDRVGGLLLLPNNELEVNGVKVMKFAEFGEVFNKVE